MELDQLLARFWESIPLDPNRPVLVVVDSVNALINGCGRASANTPTGP